MEKLKKETPEDRFRKLLTPKSKIIAKVMPGGPSELIIFNKNGSKRIVKCDEGPLLDVFGLSNAQKIEFMFEQDYPKRKALINGKPTMLFKAWINRKKFYDDYFLYGDIK